MGGHFGLGRIYLFNLLFSALFFFSFLFFAFLLFLFCLSFFPHCLSLLGLSPYFLLTTTTTSTTTSYYYRLRPSFPSDTPATWQYYLPITTTTTTD